MFDASTEDSAVRRTKMKRMGNESSWPPDRLDELAKRIERMDQHGSLALVAFKGEVHAMNEKLRSDLRAVQHELGDDGAVGRLRTTLAAAVGEPLAERRLMWQGIRQVAIGSAIAAISVALILYAIFGTTSH
jgi:hypothetical protein